MPKQPKTEGNKERKRKMLIKKPVSRLCCKVISSDREHTHTHLTTSPILEDDRKDEAVLL